MKSLVLPKLTPAQKAVATALGAALLIGGVIYSVRRLGIAESTAAALASMTTIAPAAAFLALALHRTLALVASLAAALWPGPRA